MKSNYLDNENRLADVIAAIQVMAINEIYKLDFADWADRIVGDKNKGAYWKQVFQQHPEFFRLDQARKKASLVWRRSYPKNYHVDKHTVIPITLTEYRSLSEIEQQKISRAPLSNNDIGTLINSAINLNNSAEEARLNRNWWKSALFALIGVIVGAVINYVLKSGSE